MAQDILGREFNGVVQISDLFGPVHTVVETKSPATDDKLDNLYSAINEVAARIDATAAQELQASREFTQRVLHLQDSLQAARSAPTGGAKLKSDGDVIRYLKITAGSMNALYKAATKASTIYVGITGFTPRGSSSLKRILQSCGLCSSGTKAALSGRRLGVDAGDVALKALKKKSTVAAGGGSGSGGDDDSGGGGGGGGGMGSLSGLGGAGNAKSWAWGMTKDLAALLPMLAKWTLDVTNLSPMNIIPSAKDLNSAREQVRQIVFQTRGFGDTNREMEKVYRDVGDEATRAGVTMEVYQKIWLKNLERGTHQLSEHEALNENSAAFYEKTARLEGRTLKTHLKSSRLEDLRVIRMKKVTTSALHTANRLGMDAEAVNDTFMNWHQQLGLSAGAMERIGSHMLSIARNTGVTGQRLQVAIKNVEDLAKEMRKVGTFSESVGKDLMEMSALAEKYGVSDVFQEIQAGTMTLDKFQQMDSGLRNTISIAARDAGIEMPDVWTGGLQDKDKFNELMQGVERITMDLVKTRFGSKIEAASGGRIKKDQLQMSELTEYMKMLGDRDKAALQGLLKQRGLGAGQLENLAKMNEEARMTFTDRMNKWKAELGELKTIGGEKLPEYLALQRKILEAKSSEEMSIVSAMSEAQRATGAKRMNLLADLRKRTGKDFDISDIGTHFDNAVQHLRERGELVDINVEKALRGGAYGEAFKSFADIKNALMKGGTEAELAMSAFTSLQKDIELKESKTQDPATKQRQELLEFHNKLAKTLDPWLDLLASLTDKWYWLIVAISQVGAAFAALKVLLWTFGKIKAGYTWAKGLGGGGGGPAGGPAPRTSGPAPGRGTPTMPIPPAGGSPTIPVPPAGGAPTPGTTTVAPLPPASRGAVVPAGGPDYGGRGWSGGRWSKDHEGTQRVWDRPSAAKGTMSRRDRMANAEKYLAARKAAGQSGRVPIAGRRGLFRTPTTGRFGRGTRLGRGLDLVSRGFGFLNRHRDKVATAVGTIGGAYTGYEAAPEGHGLTGALGGAVAGGALGYGAGRMMGPGSLRPGALPDLASTLMGGGTGEDMSQIPGWGQNCVPVCIVGGLDNLMGGGGLGGALGLTGLAGLPTDAGGGLAETAMDAVAVADTAADLKTATTAGRAATTTTKGIASAAAGATPEPPAPKGFLGRMWGKAKGAASGVWNKTKGVAGAAWDKTKGVAGTAWDKTKGAAGAAGKFVLDKTGLGKVTGWLGTNIKKLVPGFLKSSAGAGIKSTLKNIISKIPIMSIIMESLFAGMQISDIAHDQGLSEDDIYKQIGSTIISSGMGLIGGSLAAAMISAPQALGIPSWLFAPFAYMGGDILGRYVGSAISDYIGGPTLGKWIFDLFYGKKGGEASQGTAGTEAGLANATQENTALNEFQLGTREITQAGIAQLHEGEVVVPKSVWERIKAIGSKAFGGISHAFGDGSVKGLTSVGQLLGAGPIGMISEVFSGLRGRTDEVSANKGLNSLVERLISAMNVVETTRSFKPSPLDLGAFDRTVTIDGAGQEHIRNLAADKSITARLYESTEERQSKTDRQRGIISDLNRALDYQRSASEASEDASARLMDYSDQTQGMVSPIMTTPESVESNLERRMYGEQKSGSATTLPAMDDVFTYLNDIQARKLDTMIHYLQSIDNRLGQSGAVSSTIGRRRPSSPYIGGQGVKNIAVDLVSGAWDIGTTHYSPSAVTTEGRGGTN